MDISDMIDNLQHIKDTYGNLDVVLSIEAGTSDFGQKVVAQKIDDPEFTYFQVSKDHEILIIGD